MKNVKIVIIMICALSSFAFSQFHAGQKSIDGEATYASYSYDGDQIYSMLNLSPSLSYFVSDNVELGGGFTYLSMSDDDDSISSTGFHFGGSYHFGNNIYAGGAYYIPDTDIDDANFLILGGGYLSPLSDNVYLDFSGQYWLGMGDNEVSVLAFGAGIKVVL